MIKLTINGASHELDVDPETPLLWVLRDHLHLTGTKFGCGIAQCGACTVHVSQQPRRSCVTPVGMVQNQKITTIEGLTGPTAEAVQQSWAELDVPQCGYCQSGQVMTAVSLLEQVPNPTEQDIDLGMAGNVCRCATYARIKKAILQAAKAQTKGSAANTPDNQGALS